MELKQLEKRLKDNQFKCDKYFKQRNELEKDNKDLKLRNEELRSVFSNIASKEQFDKMEFCLVDVRNVLK